MHIKNAAIVKDAILQLQGLFIKVGQLLSILTNFLPEAFQKPLEALQDQIPARPYSEIKHRIITELGDSPEVLFSTFNPVPVAAASIGQAHRATLKDGTAVVIKVQHQNIEKIAAIDLRVMEKLVRLASWFYEIKGMEYAYTQVRKMIEEELDFSKEAHSMQLIKANLSGETQFEIPQIHPAFSSGRVLTTTYHSGVKISNVNQLKEWGIDCRELADRLVKVYCQMVFEDGFYHADPHPGNILVKEDGTLVLLDFGAVATIEPNTRLGLLELLEAAAKNDIDGIITALEKMGFIADDSQAKRISEKVIDAFRNFIQHEVKFEGLSIKDVDIDIFDNSLFNLTSQIGFKKIASTVQVPKDYVLLNRMVTLLLGICNTLDTHANPLEVVRPYFQKFILGERGDLLKYIRDLVQRSFVNALSLPNDLRKTMKKVQNGELKMQVAGTQEKHQLIYLIGQQFIFTLLLVATISFAWIFYQNTEYQMFKYAMGLGLFWVWLLFKAMWRAKKIYRMIRYGNY